MLPELLAPAGSFDAAIAAFTYGADAIYLGLSRFSARADATNFSDEELSRILAYAHSFPTPKKVYVTLNTLLETHEFADLLPSLALLEELRIDGAIVQDLGLARLIHRHFPGIPLHASTQLACTSVAGARELKRLGFVRIVTARELSLREAADISTAADIEIEVFVHGALCYSLSGLCLYSSLTTGRSGNRGRCAYCCRQAFRQPDGTSAHPFSMCDLSLLDQGQALRTLPLASLKIEGRMKNPLYVAAVTHLYRQLLDDRLTPATLRQKAEDLRTIFSRPWTPLYTRDLKTPPSAIIDSVCVGHRGAPIGKVVRVMRDMDGQRWMTFETTRALERHDGLQLDPPEGGRPIGFAVDKLRDARTKKSAITLPAGSRAEVMLPREVKGDIARGATVYCSASQAVRRAFPVATPRSTETRSLRPVDLTLTLQADALILEGEGITVRTPATLSAAKDASRSREAAEKLLSRLGDEGFSLRTLTFKDPDGLFLPASLLNATRRTWAEQLRARLATEQAEKRAHLEDLLEQTPPTARPPATQPRYTLKVAACQSPSLLGAEMPEEVVVLLTTTSTPAELDRWCTAVTRDKLRFALPVALRNHELAPISERLTELIERGYTRFECADLTSYHLIREAFGDDNALDLTADWTWYATNEQAATLQTELGITRGITGPEANLPNLLSLPATCEREVLIATFAPLFISVTRPLTERDLLIDRNGNTLRIATLGSHRITFDERPWSAVEHTDALLAAGFNRLRVDLSWAGTALLPITTWTQMLHHPTPLPSHFTDHRY